MVEQSATTFQAANARLGLLMWGVKVFGHEQDVTYDPAEWRPMLQELKPPATMTGLVESGN